MKNSSKDRATLPQHSESCEWHLAMALTERMLTIRSVHLFLTLDALCAFLSHKTSLSCSDATFTMHCSAYLLHNMQGPGKAYTMQEPHGCALFCILLSHLCLLR